MVSGERGAVEEEWSWRTGKAKVGARLPLIVDVPDTASGVTVFRYSTGYCFSIRRALASDDTESETSGPSQGQC
jgi:hypothetical protein